MVTLVHSPSEGTCMNRLSHKFMSRLTRCFPPLRMYSIFTWERIDMYLLLFNQSVNDSSSQKNKLMTKRPVFLWANSTTIQRWSSLQNTRSRGRGWIQIQLLPPYIYLNLHVSTPWSLNRPISTPKPTKLHPLDVDPAPPPGSLFCSEGLLTIHTDTTLVLTCMEAVSSTKKKKKR